MEETKLDKDINVRSKTELSDEEIVKALECCVKEEHKDCVHCGEFVSQFDCMRSVISDGLDLIYRLQNTEKANEEAWEIKEESYKRQMAEQKAEIERLTEAHERIAWSKKQYLDWVHGFLSTHTDMKDRGEKFEMFDRDWMCGVFWAKIEGSIEYIIDLEKQRNELKKQVDEYRRKIKDKELIELPFMSKEILEDYAHRMFDSWNDITGALHKGCSWYGEALSVIDDIVGMAYGITKRQTENATAEEIYSFLKEHSSGAGFSLVRAYFMEHYGI